MFACVNRNNDNSLLFSQIELVFAEDSKPYQTAAKCRISEHQHW